MSNRNPYMPSFFLAMLCPRDNITNEQQLHRQFVETAKKQPDLSVATKSFLINLVYSESTEVAADQEINVILLLHGEIYNTTKPGQAAFLIDQYKKRGLEFSKDINGSFASLVIDKRNDAIALITDRLNTRKVFYSKFKNRCWLSTSLYAHPLADVDIDSVGITCYLANGAMVNNRTLFEGVRILPRASVHKLSPKGLETTRYWSYEFAESNSNIDENKLKAELSELFIESIRRRLKNRKKVFLSLSAGYDSTGILGILGSKLDVSGVGCFSYCYGQPQPASDEYVSKQMVKEFGFKHRAINSYNGDLSAVIKHNGNMGQGLAHFCDEVDAWKTLSDQLSEDKNNVMFVGDMYSSTTCYKLRCNLSDLDEVLPYVGIYNSLILKPYRALVECSNGKISPEGWGNEYNEIIKNAPPYKDIRNCKDYIYLDQRIPHVLTCWREYFQSPFVNVSSPYLDNDILDFTMKLSADLRDSKILYKKVLREMFPALFKFKRARTSGKTNWRKEFIGRQEDIKLRILSQRSKLDDIIPPDIILDLLKTNTSWKSSKFGLRSLPAQISQKYLNDTRTGNAIIKRFPFINTSVMLKRILLVREFLSRF